MDEEERHKVEQRLLILDGLVGALDSWAEISACVWRAPDRRSARQSLQRELGLSEIVANYVLDLPTYRLTEQGRAQLEEEAAELRKLL